MVELRSVKEITGMCNFLMFFSRVMATLLPVVIDVADNDGQKADEEDDSSGVDDRVEGLDAGGEVLHTAKILKERHMELN